MILNLTKTNTLMFVWSVNVVSESIDNREVQLRQVARQTEYRSVYFVI